MNKTLIVPLDGSDLAERALTYATGIAQQTTAKIVIINIAPIGTDEPRMNERRAYLRSVADRLDNAVDTELIRGRAAESIVKIADSHESPLIIMSTHGRGGIPRMVIGSVADEVVRTSVNPVLLIRADVELREPLAIRTVLLPLDGSAAGNRAIEQTLSVASTFGSRVHLVRVVDTPSVYAMMTRNMDTMVSGDLLDEITAQMTQEATKYLDGIAERFHDRGLETRIAVLEGYPGETLLQYERQGAFDLTIMATAGRGGIGRIVFGSVAERILKLGRSPVMMLRPRPEDLKK